MAETKSAEDLEKDVQAFRQWVNSQPQLPKDIGDHLLLRFLHSCYYDTEKAKAALLNFCSLRLTAPELFTNRDPLSKQMKSNFSIVKLAQLQISGNRNLWIWQLNDPGLEKYDYLQDARLFFLTTDSWLLGEERLEEGDVAILDVKDISLRFLAKFNVSVARKLSKYQEEAMPIRLKQIHLINAPPFIDKIYGLMKPFMRQDYCDMMHFHTPKSDTLHKYFEKSELPEEFGGTAGSLDEHNRAVVEDIEKKREHFLNENLWKMIDVKKSKGSKAEVGTDVGSFRSLAID